MVINYDRFISIGTYETLEAISRQVSMKYHRDFFEYIERFPSDFYFQLMSEELKNILRPQFGTLKQEENIKIVKF